MKNYFTKEKSSVLSSDAFEDLLNHCQVISIPKDNNDSPPTTVDSAENKPRDPMSSKEIRDKDCIVIPNLGSLGELPECIDKNRIFVAVDRKSTLYESKSIAIDKDSNVHRHYYYIENDDCLKFKSLHYTIVFSGVFDGPDYQAAEIDVSLKRLSSEREPISALNMGTKTLKSRNSINSIGLITIDHELEDNVIESGLIELTITAESASSYSIRIYSETLAWCVELEVKRYVIELREKEHDLEKCKSMHQTLFLLEQLLERKIKVVEDLKEHDIVSIEKCKEKLDRLEDELDQSDGNDDEDTVLLRKIDALSIRHRHLRSLKLKKEDARKDLASKMGDVKLEIMSNLKEKERLVNETGEARTVLSSACTTLGHHVCM